jgi:predicted nucleic acid-binding protein
LDSSFLVDFLDPEQTHHDAATEWMREHADEPQATPVICTFEVLRGAARAGDDRFDRAVGFLRTLEVLELGFEEAIARAAWTESSTPTERR